MNKLFTKRFTRNLWITHFLVTLGIVLVIFSLGVLMDYSMNGTIVDLVASTFSYRVASYINSNKPMIISTIIIIFVFIGWLIVERRAMNTMTEMIGQLDTVLKKDDRMITLSRQFKEVEHFLNAMKLENIRNEQLAETEIQRKNDLISYLAHDIKTPLSSVIGYLSILTEVPDLPQEQRIKYTNISLEKANRLESLINEFFDITRFNLSSIPLEMETISLSFMLFQMSEEFYPMLAPGNRKIEVSVDDNQCIYGDPDKLARVFNNILKNAIAYSYPNSTIYVKVESEGMEDRIQFINHGKIIPPDKIKMIFEKFYRLDSSRSSNTGGAGLGLAIAREIIQAHEGSLEVTSTEECTTFTIKLPKSGMIES